MTLVDDIAALRARIAARPHSGELLWDDYRRLAELERQRADAAEADKERLHFAVLARDWWAGTGYMSSPTSMMEHPAFLELVAFGPKAISWVLEEWQERDADWFLVLRKIVTKEELPVYPEGIAGNYEAIKALWMDWGAALHPNGPELEVGA